MSYKTAEQWVAGESMLRRIAELEARLAAVIALCDDDRFKHMFGQMRRVVRATAVGEPQ